ncbi:hypothetical protein D3C77_298400 [compost metagenome]
MGRVIHRQRVQTQRQLLDVLGCLYLPMGKAGEQSRDQFQRLLQASQRRRTNFHAALKHPVEQVLGRPGQFGQPLRANHPPTALEGVQAASQLYQGVTVGRVGLPARPLFMQLGQQLISFFEEHLAQLVIDHRRFDNRRFDLNHCRFGLRLRRIAQRGQAGLSRIEKVPGVGLRISYQPLQIALTRAQRIRQMRQRRGIRWCGAKHAGLDIITAMAKQRRRTGQHEHGQRTANLLQQARQYQQALG